MSILILWLFYRFATFPWMYLVSTLFKDAEMAFISYVCINLFISVNTIISTAIVYFLGQLNQNDEVRLGQQEQLNILNLRLIIPLLILRLALYV